MTATGTGDLGAGDAVEHLLGAPCPACSARSAASWITGPSIIGSEKGMPTSTASAPAADHRRQRLRPVVGHARP